jgi:hypothetical protein
MCKPAGNRFITVREQQSRRTDELIKADFQIETSLSARRAV